MLSTRCTFEAIGTIWTIDTDITLTEPERRQIADTIELFDKTYSRFRADSLVNHIRRTAPGAAVFPDSMTLLYDMYRQLCDLTGGKINPLVGASLERLGYDAKYSLRNKGATPAPVLQETISMSGNALMVTRPVLLDVGAVGKGYLVDVVAGIIGRTHAEYVVDGSGDLMVCADAPERVGLEHPADPTRVIGVVSLTNGSLCASAMNRRTWGKGLHHIIDATTGRPLAGDVIAVWALAGTTILADALATALFFVPPAAARAVFGNFGYVILKRDGSTEHNLSPDVGEIFV